MTPLVSVVVPCFRQGHLLAVAVGSALAQTHPAVEVVVVNDGSDDDTHAVARRFAGRIVYVNQPNRGLAAARNAGVRAAGGELLHFLDADDHLHPDALAHLVAAAGAADPLVGMGWRPFEDDPARPTGPDTLPPPAGDFTRAMLTACYGPPHCFLTGRGVFDRVGGFDERMRGCADWDLWLRLLFAGATPGAARFVGAGYRQSPGQMSRQAVHMAEELARAVGKVPGLVAAHPGRVRGWGLDPAVVGREFRRRAAKEAADAAYQRRQRGDYRAAAGHYLRCIRAGGLRAGLGGLAKLLPHGVARRAGRA